MLLAVFCQSIIVANAQSDVATVIIQPSTGGTTDPAPGTYTYANGTNIVLTATPDAGYAFHYWIVSGNATPGHAPGIPNYIIDPDTGDVVGTIPRVPVPTDIDSLVFTTNPANITCGYGYTFQYQAVFTPANPTTTPTNNTAVVIILPSLYGTTSPAPGTYTYDLGSNITLMATPSSGYAFHYWVVSGNVTPSHEPGQPNYIIDPDTGEIIGSIPRPPIPTGIDSLVFTTNPANITCGYGYTFQYQAVFTPAVSASPSPSPTASPTPSATASPTPVVTATPTATPESTSGGLSMEVIVAIVVVVIIIIVVIAAVMMRRKK
jgi:hypothetical protein